MGIDIGDIKKTPTELLIKKQSKSTKVAIGTFAGIIATVLVHPIDVVKVHMQLREKSISTIEVTRLIVKCKGLKALYSGLSAGVMRQSTSTTTRLITFLMLHERYKTIYNIPTEASLSSSEKAMIGIYAGLLGAFAGVPSEVVLVRLMGDEPELCGGAAHVRRYRGAFHALNSIVHEEGVKALWRGGTLTLARSVIVSVAQIGTYAEINKHLKSKKILEGLPAHIFISICTSLVTTLLSLPIDVIKIRYQVRRDTVTQADILNDILGKKGLWYLWKGMTPYFARMSIHTIVSLMIFQYVVETFYQNDVQKKNQ